MDEKTQTKIDAKTKRFGLIAASALVVALAAPLAAVGAQAAHDDGGFTIRSVDSEGFEAFAGMTPKEGGTGSTAPEPGATPVQKTITIRQSVNFTLQDRSYANAAWVLRYRYGVDEWTEVSGQASPNGYANAPILKERKIPVDESYEAEPLEITLEASTGQRVRWTVPADRFRRALGTPLYDENDEEVLDENGEVVREQPWAGIDGGHWADMIMFYDGKWSGAALPMPNQ